jgi:hypothetical protein
MVAAGALYGLAFELQANVGLRLSVDSQVTKNVLDGSPGSMAVLGESVVGERRVLDIQRAATWSLAGLMKGMVAGAARTLRAE